MSRVLTAVENAGWGFWPRMGVAAASTVVDYAGMTYCLNHLGVVG